MLVANLEREVILNAKGLYCRIQGKQCSGREDKEETCLCTVMLMCALGKCRQDDEWQCW
jgi:hypothetical protein